MSVPKSEAALCQKKQCFMYLLIVSLLILAFDFYKRGPPSKNNISFPNGFINNYMRPHFVNFTIYTPGVSNVALRRIGINPDRQYKVHKDDKMDATRPVTVTVWGTSHSLPDVTRRCPASIPCKFISSADKNLTAQSDFIMFHLKSIASSVKSFKAAFPARNPHQRLVIHHRESPANTGSSEYLTKYNNFFNFTAYYSSKADAAFAYGQCVKNDNSIEQHIVNHARSKTKFAMWMASNCNAVSKRQDYVQSLKQHIPLDIYGSCGTFKFTNCHTATSKLTTEECFEHDQKTIEKYKFYLSFENSFCDDYISEKAYRAMRGDNNPLPVMMGAGPYDKYFPPGSYLEVKNFSSAKALADWMHYLDKNEQAYNSYFTWKNDYTCSWPGYYCALCDAIYDLKDKYNVVTNMQEIFHTKQCISPSVYHN